jgi:hypothetical protein
MLKVILSLASIAVLTGCSPQALDSLKPLDVSSFNTSVSNNGAISKSNGFRWGHITKLSKQMFTGYYEGEMLVGANSTMIQTSSTDANGNTTIETMNPWNFTISDERVIEELKTVMAKQGGYATVSYEQLQIPGIGMDSDYIITGAYEKTTKPVVECGNKNVSSGWKSGGFRQGRVVKMSKKGLIVPSFELTIQQGDSGNNFHQMSLPNGELAKCLLDVLASNTNVTINYNDARMINPQDTTYEITGIIPVSKFIK